MFDYKLIRLLPYDRNLISRSSLQMKMELDPDIEQAKRQDETGKPDLFDAQRIKPILELVAAGVMSIPTAQKILGLDPSQNRPDTGKADIVRYTVFQDAGKAVHPSYVEGQMQGGAVQGIGWALNEEYIYGDDGKLQNPGFLDYRVPVCSDVPMIDTVIVEVPNPGHPYGVRGVGETPICPPMAAIANAIENATHIRFTALPLSPPRVLKALESNRMPDAAE